MYFIGQQCYANYESVMRIIKPATFTANVDKVNLMEQIF